MAPAKYLIALTNDEEKVAQLLTRDAWSFFTDIVSSLDHSHAKEMPCMPRQGTFVIAADPELIQYYLDYAQAYNEELNRLGWEVRRSAVASSGFAKKLEEISGQRIRALPESERWAS